MLTKNIGNTSKKCWQKMLVTLPKNVDEKKKCCQTSEKMLAILPKNVDEKMLVTLLKNVDEKKGWQTSEKC
jgi:hypothetical protein